MKLTVSLFLAAATLVLTQAQLSPECKAEAEVMMQCIEDSKSPREGKSERRAAKNACFVENGCRDPSERGQCLRATMNETILPKFEECIGQELPSFVKKMILRHAGKGRRHGGRRDREERMARKLDEFCPDEDTADAAEQCLQDLKEGREEGGWGRRRGPLGDRSAMMECFARMRVSGCTEELMAEKRRMKELSCECAEELRDDEEINASLSACLDGDDDEVDELIKKSVDKMCRKKSPGSGSWGRKK